MERKRIESGVEQQIVTALVTCKPFLAGIAGALDPGLLQTPYAQLLARWCLKHFKTFGRAPKGQIEAIYHAWAEAHSDNPNVEPLARFLGHLSRTHDDNAKPNVAYLFDLAGKYLTRQRVRRLHEALGEAIGDEDNSQALDAITQFRALDLTTSGGVEPTRDRDVWARSFADPLEPLLRFGGDAGEFFNAAMTRDSLIGIQGPEKRGKTNLCVELIVRALRARRKVALFEVGDLTESQIMKRLGMRWAGRPLWASQCKGVRVPTAIYVARDEEGNPQADVRHKIVTFDSVVNERSAWRGARRFRRLCNLPSGDHLMVSVHANSSINVRGIDGVLTRWEHERGFVPEVVVIDYADILAPEDPRQEFRHQVNETWKALRRLSQVRHCLVIAPTQAAASAYDTTTQKMKNFSEDKRKLAHVTGLLGLNQTETEKALNVMRLNWIVLRESEFRSEQCLWVAQCPALAQAIVCATKFHEDNG